MRIKKADVLMNSDKVPVLIQKKGTNYPDAARLDSPANVTRVMTDVFLINRQIGETVYLIAMDIKGNPLNFFCVNKGTVNASLVDVRGIMIRLLLSNAASFILVHNHVSGETEPSQEDIAVTKKISEASKIVGVAFCDHIIVGDSYSFYSFRESRPELI